MNVTSEFDKWAQKTEKELQNIDGFAEKLEYLAGALRERYGIAVRFVEILGKRWSHLAGWGGEHPSFHLEQIRLSEKLGMVVETNHPIPDLEKKRLTAWVKEKILPALIGENQLVAPERTRND